MEQHQRYASFIATTNDQQPLTDPSGSRRFLCIETTGSIDLKRTINYPQLYAQAVAEIQAGKPTYFNRRQEQRIQRSNQPY
jgi:predicted P-loop ATPase